MTAVDGLILAGGYSRRMGQDKALIKLGRQTLVEHCQTLLLDAGCQNIYISSNHLDSGIPDRFKDFGPVAGLEAVLYQLLETESEAEAEQLVVMPVDMPLMTPQLLEQLIQQPNEFEFCHYDSSPLPCRLKISRNVHQTILQALEATTEDKGFPIKGLFHLLKSSKIPLLDSQRYFMNCNTPDELLKIRQQLS